MLLIKVLSTAGAISRFRINRDNSTAVVKCSGSGSLKIRVDMFFSSIFRWCEGGRSGQWAWEVSRDSRLLIYD